MEKENFMGRWKRKTCLWMVKFSIIPKLIYIFNAIVIKTQQSLFTELDKLDYNIYIYKNKDWKVDDRLLKKKVIGLPYQILTLVLKQQERKQNSAGETNTPME